MTSMAGTTTTNAGAHHQQHHNRPSFDLTQFWQDEMTTTQTSVPNFRTHPLPLARIKKVMKTDPEVKMISAEAPILFAKACETFIAELTKRAWVHAEESKRRTLLRSDIAMGISKTDMCDFLIDIVPRMEATDASKSACNSTDAMSTYPYHHQPEQQHITTTATTTTIPYPDTNTTPSSGSDKQPCIASSSAPMYLSGISQMSEEQIQQYQLQIQQFMAHLTRTQQQELPQQQQRESPAATGEDNKNTSQP